MMVKKIYYFAYGANSYPEMIKSIIGRAPSGFKYELKGYRLGLQKWKDIPQKVKTILMRWWSKDFSSYSIMKSKEHSVIGRIWKITRKERELVGNWELHNIWYKPIKIKRKINKRLIILETEMISKGLLNHAKNNKPYYYFPVNKKQILHVAKKVRKDYLKQNR